MQTNPNRYHSPLTDDYPLLREDSPVHFKGDRDCLGSFMEELNDHFARNFDEFSKEKVLT